MLLNPTGCLRNKKEGPPAAYAGFKSFASWMWDGETPPCYAPHQNAIFWTQPRGHVESSEKWITKWRLQLPPHHNYALGVMNSEFALQDYRTEISSRCPACL